MISRTNLEDYFILLAAGNYAKAKRIIEGMSAAGRHESRSCLSKLLNGFVTITNLERKYYSFEFLISKRRSLFSRKESYSESYGDLLAQLDGLDVDDDGSQCGGNGSECGGDDDARRGGGIIDEGWEMSRVAKAIICQICRLRYRMTEMYVEVSQLGKQDDRRSIVDLVELVRPVRDFVKLSLAANRLSTLASIAKPILAVIELEIDVLMCLSEAQQLMSNLFFLVPINLLHSANDKCHELLQSCSYLTRSTRLFSRHSHALQLVSWLIDFYNVSLAKYTLYFHPILIQRMAHLPLTSVTPHESRAFEFVHRITNFVKKASVSSFLLIFDATKQNQPFLGHGYVLPSNGDGCASGLKSYPVIFSCPVSSELLPHKLHCSIIMLIGRMENSSQRDDAIDYLAEPDGSRTYFLAHIDYRVYLILLFEERRDREKLIINFIENVRTDLNGKSIIDQLASMSS